MLNWNDFRKAHKHKGWTQTEMSEAYHKQQVHIPIEETIAQEVQKVEHHKSPSPQRKEKQKLEVERKDDQKDVDDSKFEITLHKSLPFPAQTIRKALDVDGFIILRAAILPKDINHFLEHNFVLDPNQKFASQRMQQRLKDKNMTLYNCVYDISKCISEKPRDSLIVTTRSKGRFDLQLPSHVPNVLSLYQKELLDLLMDLVKTSKHSGKIRTHNILITQPKAVTQDWHVDDGHKLHGSSSYFTVILALTPCNFQTGTTEVRPGSHHKHHLGGKGEEGGQPSVLATLNPGDLIVFDGRLEHRGTGNSTNNITRLIYYTVISNHLDENVV